MSSTHPDESELLKFAQQQYPCPEAVQSHLASCNSCLETLTIFLTISDSESDDVAGNKEREDKALIDAVLRMIKNDEARLRLN